MGGFYNEKSIVSVSSNTLTGVLPNSSEKTMAVYQHIRDIFAQYGVPVIIELIMVKEPFGEEEGQLILIYAPNLEEHSFVIGSQQYGNFLVVVLYEMYGGTKSATLKYGTNIFQDINHQGFAALVKQYFNLSVTTWNQPVLPPRRGGNS